VPILLILDAACQENAGISFLISFKNEAVVVVLARDVDEAIQNAYLR
jgi:hypothetical protein